VLREGEAGDADANLGEAAGTGCGDGPAIARESLQDFDGAGEGDDAVGVFDFAALDDAIFGLVVSVGEKLADSGEAGTAVGLTNDVVGNKAVSFCPESPDTCYDRGGVYKDAIQIEEDAAAVNFHVLMIPISGLDSAWWLRESVGDECAQKKRWRATALQKTLPSDLGDCRE